MMTRLSEFDVQRIADAVIAKMPVQDEVLTTEQVANMLQTTPDALVARVRRGTFCQPHRRGKLFYFSKNEVTKWLLDDEYCINN